MTRLPRTSGWGPDVRSKNWCVKFPRDAYALGPVEFDAPITELELREWAKRWEGSRQLPRGFQCWPWEVQVAQEAGN